MCCSISVQFGRGAKKDIRSATATTTEMVGKLNLRVLHGGAATLHSIKVMQPKQVSVKTLTGLPFYVCAHIQNLTTFFAHTNLILLTLRNTLHVICHFPVLMLNTQLKIIC